jgi:hypothetical protein
MMEGETKAADEPVSERTPKFRNIAPPAAHWSSNYY